MKYCLNDFEFYKSLLVQFATEAADKIPLINRYYESSDFKNYEILVHALKSTSKMIGAGVLSDKAKQLELAAKEKREEFIKENHYPMMSEYGALYKGLTTILSEEIREAKEEKKEEEAPKEEPKDEEILEFSAEEPSSENKEESEEILEFIPDEEEGGTEK